MLWLSSDPESRPKLNPESSPCPKPELSFDYDSEPTFEPEPGSEPEHNHKPEPDMT